MSLADVSLRLVDSLDEAHAFLSWLGERRPIIGVDSETVGLEWWAPHFLRMVQVGDAQTGWAIPTGDWRGIARKGLAAIADSGQAVAMWNAPFDMHALETDGLPLPAWHRVHDGLVQDHLLDPLRPHGLKAAADRLYPGASAGQGWLRKVMSENGWSWATVPDDHPAYWSYAALDPVITCRLVENYWPKIQPFAAAYDREMQARSILWRAEKKGMGVDVNYTARLRAEWQAEASVLRGELAKLGVPNPSSNRQLEQALKAVGWEPEEFTATGAAKLDKVILTQLAATVGAEVAPRVLRYKRLVKWISAYLDSFLGRLDNGRIHASINTLAARTGRMSINNPGLQTLPRGPEIRRCIVPANGSHLLTVDWDSQEGRVFAHYAQDPNLCNAFRDGLDVHRYAAGQAYGIAPEAVTPEQRQIAKAVTFAKLYGAGVNKLADTAGITRAEAETFVARYEEAFPGVPRMMKEIEQIGRRRAADEGSAYVTTWGGRRVCAKADETYKLTNALVQGGCADVLKQVIVDLDAAGLGDYIVAPVHDELVFEIPAPEFGEARQQIVEIMTRDTDFAVPLTVHASEALANWGGDLAEVAATAAA